MFAEVVVHTPTRQELGDPDAGVFTYAVPDALRAHLGPGHLVWVPFANRRLQGIVIRLTDQAPTVPTRPIEALARPHPIVTPQQLELARWISRRYLAPLLDCIRMMLPSGVARRVDSLIELTAKPPFPDDLLPEQRELLALLQRRPLTRRQLRRRAPQLARRSIIDPLVQRGLIAVGRSVVEPAARPRTGRRVRLVADAVTIERVLPTLGRSSRQADALAWLATSSDPLPGLADVCAAVGCSEGVIRSLAERGWVKITPQRRMLLVLDPTAAREALETSLSRAPAQAAALAALLDRPQPVEESAFRREASVRPETLRALEKRGLIRRELERSSVVLTIDPGEVKGIIEQLRGLERYHRVLDALQKAGGEAWVGFLYAESGCDLVTLRELEAAGLIALEDVEIERDPLAGRVFTTDRPPELTADQQVAWETLRAGLLRAYEPTLREKGEDAPPPVYLLHGVTGSGKTELYLRAIAEALAHQRQAIVLVPEIALTPQTIQRFAARFPGRVTVWHSELSRGERFDLWRRIHNGEIDIVIGSRSALFVPLPRLGLIVVDEEHEPAYKQERTPRYHARDVAIALGRIARAPVILGSATPSLEAYHAAWRGRIHLIALPRRVLAHRATVAAWQTRLGKAVTHFCPQEGEVCYAELPTVEIVDLRQELRAGNRSIFSRALQEALAQTLARKEQAILFLNRRGAATFVMCRDCGFVLRCKRCDVPLTYHKTPISAGDAGGEDLLICHHCNRRTPVPHVCPQCGSSRIRYFGAGTQRVVNEVLRLFPTARVVRWDRDTTGRRGAHERILAQFVNHQADVLVGTQMVAKGLDLPLVTLVGVVAADIGLYLPDFRAAERTFQLLAQVAGRAGRSPLGGRVIVQTYYPEHYAIRAASRHDFEAFYRQELRFRHEHGYPPFTRLARLIYAHTNPDRAQEESERLAAILRRRIGEREDVSLIGPVPCFFSRLRGRYRWQIILRSSRDPADLIRGLSLSPGWRIDVDPIDVL
ncbi:MAG TPA: primosomal protein N' [Caldilineae bacterium]|nr:primosomal protein N' [Caldilineae bacterium]